MPDIRTKDLTTSTDWPSSDDFLESDGNINATRKLSAAGLISAFGSRQPLLGLQLSDGVSSGRRVEWTLGAAGDVSGSPITIAGILIRVPTSNPTASPYFAFIGPTGSPNSAFSQNTLALGIGWTTSGALQIRQYGATVSDFRFHQYDNHRANNSGKWIRVDAVISGGTATLYQDGTALTPSFPDQIGGTAPAWGAAITATAYSVAYLPNTEFRPGTLINRALTAAEISQMIQAGALLPRDRAGGDMVNRWAAANAGSSGATDANSVAALTSRHSTASAVAGSRPGGAGSWVLRGTNNAADWDMWLNVALPYTQGQVFYWECWARSNITANISFGLFGAVIPEAVSGIALSTAWQFFSGYFVMGAGGTITRLSFGRLGGVVAVPGDWYEVDDIVVRPIGAILQSEITRTAQVLDHGQNRIRGIATAGVRPLSDRDPVGLRGTQTATGFALGLGSADPVWFEPALITALRIKQASATAQTITLRLNSSGGTVIATATTAANTDWQTVALSIPGGFEISSGDRLHWTITNALDWNLEWTRR